MCAKNRPRKFKLHVIEVTNLTEDISAQCKTLGKILQNQQWCLDFDMDFYSTQNPFMDLLGHNFEFIDCIFRYRDLGDLSESLEFRKTQLDCLKELCSTTVDDKVEENLSKGQKEFFSSEVKHKFPNWQDSMKEAKLLAKDDEYITDLFYIGQQTELPHHLSTKSEIETLLSNTESLLSSLQSAPVAITLARSEYDEYSTQETLDFVHCKLVCLIKKLYNVQSGLECPNV